LYFCFCLYMIRYFKRWWRSGTSQQRTDSELTKCKQQQLQQQHAYDMSYSWYGPLPADAWRYILSFIKDINDLRHLMFVNKSFVPLVKTAFARISRTRPDVRSIINPKWSVQLQANAVAMAIVDNRTYLFESVGDRVILSVFSSSSEPVLQRDIDCLRRCTIRAVAYSPKIGFAFITHNQPPGQIIVASKDFSVVGSFGNVQNPWGITFDHNDNIVVCDSDNCRVAVFTSTGKLLRTFGTHGDGTGQLRFPNQVVVDVHDNIWVVEMNNNRVQQFPADGSPPKLFTFQSSPLSCPCGIEVDNMGQIYVADCHHHRVAVYESSGRLIHEFWNTKPPNAITGRLNGPYRIRIRDDGQLMVLCWTELYAF